MYVRVCVQIIKFERKLKSSRLVYNDIPMSQDSAVPSAVYDPPVYDQLRVRGVPHQNCKHHSLNLAGQSLHT